MKNQRKSFKLNQVLQLGTEGESKDELQYLFVDELTKDGIILFNNDTGKRIVLKVAPASIQKLYSRGIERRDSS